MHPIKILAKLSVKTVNYNSTGKGSNDEDIIDWRTAAHSLVGLSKEVSDWAFYRFAGHDEKINTITRTLVMLVTLYVKINKYKIKPETLMGIVKASILEFTMPVCRECSGSGWILQKGNQTECVTCNGQGRKIVSNRERCKVIGINKAAYTANHDTVTKEIMKIISGWEGKIIKNVTEKMKSEEEYESTTRNFTV